MCVGEELSAGLDLRLLNITFVCSMSTRVACFFGLQNKDLSAAANPPRSMQTVVSWCMVARLWFAM